MVQFIPFVLTFFHSRVRSSHRLKYREAVLCGFSRRRISSGRLTDQWLAEYNRGFEEGFEHFQQVIDVTRLASLVILHGKELLDVDALDGVHFLHPKLTVQIPLQIFQLLLVVADGLG